MRKISEDIMYSFLQKEIREYEKAYRRLGIDGEFEIEIGDFIYNWLKTKFVPIDDFIIEDATMFGWKVRVIEGMGTNIRLVRKLELENIKVEIKELEDEQS